MASDESVVAPSPELVSAMLVVGDLDVARVPLWAAYWVADGYDGPSVVALAALSGDDLWDVREKMPLAFAELRVAIPSFAEAWHRVAIEHASACLSGRYDELELAQWVDRIYIGSDCCDDFFAEPLSTVYGIDDELIGGWGRSESDLRSAVRNACADQLRQGETSDSQDQ